MAECCDSCKKASTELVKFRDDMFDKIEYVLRNLSGVRPALADCDVNPMLLDHFREKAIRDLLAAHSSMADYFSRELGNANHP